ncbi:TrkH family potassium uptake protein [Roseofilum capinflatum]|uniref:TrkH family potassium uptake protein n=1 Tax=Roseofilum capinflatum BLCC-M114 TaxID=3022440 RepID=A0ABT7B458_9CYAN|nr:TrkH family potassium uptake protein [Roseofilum capinflatum]MDJ1173972.1 TrkH family potassium uptake protein [Roseofilum capinflatum BLCC-M114]
MSVARTICLGFLAVIAIGTLLLMLPFAITSEGFATIDGPLDYMMKALFTATSSVCVTGLSIVDVSQFYTFWGQLFLCLLFQVGGLGYMTATTFLLLLLGRQLGLRDKLAIQQSLDTQGMEGVGQLVRSIIAVTLIFEITGIFLLMQVFQPDYGDAQGLWLAIFHSISAFNNAGFSLFSDSLSSYATSTPLVTVITALIILGGIGYQVIMELYTWFYRRVIKRNQGFTFSLHFKIVTSTNIALFVIGALAFFQTEFYNPATLDSLDLWEKVLAAWFQSVTTRTAGFNTIDIGQMTITSLFITIPLMFIGASPGSTGGGIKTTTFRILLSATRAALQERDQVLCYKRQIPNVLLIKAVGVIIASLFVIICGTILVSIASEDIEFLAIFFEVVSAFSTVGLSTGITASLSQFSKLVIILIMYIGRVGILLLMASFYQNTKPKVIRYSEEDLLIG